MLSKQTEVYLRKFKYPVLTDLEHNCQIWAKEMNYVILVAIMSFYFWDGDVGLLVSQSTAFIQIEILVWNFAQTFMFLRECSLIALVIPNLSSSTACKLTFVVLTSEIIQQIMDGLPWNLVQTSCPTEDELLCTLVSLNFSSRATIRSIFSLSNMLLYDQILEKLKTFPSTSVELCVLTISKC